ncbi:MAG: proton-conducting transporter membrane subunit [Candidatus Margulisiibacteriota bacterium]
MSDIFMIDGFSRLMLIAANAVAFFVLLYSIGYLKGHAKKLKYYILFFLMLIGINGVILTNDLIAMFFFIEIGTLSAYALVAFADGKRELEASIKYFFMGEIASLLILFAFGLIYASTGTFNMKEAALNFPLASLPQATAGIKGLIALLLLIGFGVKSAAVPFHSWLPDAHTSAPSPVSAMLSGVIIKVMGIYALMRIIFNVIGMTPEISTAMLGLGVVSILVGGILAVGQFDMKRLMAYSSISQIGYILLGFGLANPLGVMGALFHIFNHAFMKSLLFLNAGAVERMAGSRDLRELGGLSKKMPVTFVSSLIATFSISGIPPFNGFWSKLYIIVGCAYAGNLGLGLVAVIGSLLTLASFLRVQKYAFFGELKENLTGVKEVPFFMGASMLLLAIICFGVGIMLPYVMQFVVGPAASAVLGGVGL